MTRWVCSQVWDVKSSQPMANFRGHHSRLLSVAFSDLDPDLVYTGGDDFCVYGWRPSEQKHQAPPSGGYSYLDHLRGCVGVCC